MTELLQWNLKAGNYAIPITARMTLNTIELKFRYNKFLLAEVKSMMGAKWDAERKIWTITNNARNNFNLAYLRGENPFKKYDAELLPFESTRPLYGHQCLMASFAMTRRQCILACEMGTGKTLVAIEVMEKVAQEHPEAEFWYVAPKSGLRAVNLELEKWRTPVRPLMMTYEGLVKRMKQGGDAPILTIFDECSKIKNPSAQRSMAAMYLADCMRQEQGDPYIILMSGTPAPKSPVDWWHQCEVACPGYLKEGSTTKLLHRLAIIEQRESISGGTYPHLVEWNTDEVAKLYSRMRGLVEVKFKKDCLDLPEKIYEIIKVKPTVEILRASQLIRQTAGRAVTALNLLRELSDGFQYKEVKTGEKPCPACGGTGKMMQMTPKEAVDPLKPLDVSVFEKQESPCDSCVNGIQPIYSRTVEEVPCPKDDILREELDLAEDEGRIVIWGGYTATIDRIVKICEDAGWLTLRVDGRGYHSTVDSNELLKAMDRSHPDYAKYLKDHPKLAFVGNPEAGGMGLTLTGACVEIFFSNSFKGEARMQSEDRCHRPGMKGIIIKDLIHLPTDQLVLDNLRKKRELQSLTLGEIEGVFNAY